MGSTTTYALPYPEQSDPADVPVDVKQLADAIDALLTSILPPVGAPIPWLVNTIPSGYIEFAGQAITAGTYPKLFGLFGGTLPDLRGKTLLGANATYPIATNGGEAAHTLSVAEMPMHSHTAKYINANLTDGGTRAAVRFGPITAAATEIVDNSGGGGAHNNLPPYRTVRWITVAA